MRTLTLLCSLLLAACSAPSGEAGAVASSLDAYVATCLDEAPTAELAPELERLAAEVAAAFQANGRADLTFICTHNSRRSHLAQIWAQVGARRFGLDGVRTFSGGTEATAFNPRAVAALERAGFTIERGGNDPRNPVYAVRESADGTAMECFSKVYSDFANPRAEFIAVMTCSSADRACPEVDGARARFATPYVDPKVSDGTEREAATYDERCAQIARDMLWVMRRASARL